MYVTLYDIPSGQPNSAANTFLMGHTGNVLLVSVESSKSNQKNRELRDQARVNL